MKNTVVAIVLTAIATGMSSVVWSDEKSDRGPMRPTAENRIAEVGVASIDCYIPLVRTLSRHKDIVAALEDINKKPRLSLAAIRQIENVWAGAAHDKSPVAEVLQHPLSMLLKNMQAKNSAMAESFIVGPSGELIAATNKTIDFWQGDEAVFTHPFNGSGNGLYVSPVIADTSDRVMMQKISMPVVSATGVTLGVLVFGINLFVSDFRDACK